MKSLHLLITGRVQGVGFRDWLVHEATQRGLTGWVRNVNRDKVEAVIAGPDEAVDDCVQHCWRGPNLAKVNDISIMDAPFPGDSGFTQRSSVS
jgi:acylphosphatase